MATTLDDWFCKRIAKLEKDLIEAWTQRGRDEWTIADLTKRLAHAEHESHELSEANHDLRAALVASEEANIELEKKLGAKTCGCGATYTAETWAELPFVGIQDDGVEKLALRNCRCGSTLAKEVA